MNIIRFHSLGILDPNLCQKISQQSRILDPARMNIIRFHSNGILDSKFISEISSRIWDLGDSPNEFHSDEVLAARVSIIFQESRILDPISMKFILHN